MKKTIIILLIATKMFAHNFLDEEIANFKKNAVLISGNANRELAQKISENLSIPLTETKVAQFNDGEVSIQIKENVRNKNVFIIQPTCKSTKIGINDSLMELYLLIRTAKRASTGSITIVVPYYGYARQDRKVTPRVPISAADIAIMLEHAGANRVLTVDLHCGQIQGFFKNAPVDNLYASSIFVPYLKTKNLENIVVVSPDAGGVDRASKLAKKLNEENYTTSLAIISKKRAKAGVVESMHLIGKVKDADAIIVDDLCDTGGTLVKAAELLKNKGAKRVFAVITHPVFSLNALEKINTNAIDEMIISDTIPLRGQAPKNLKIISIAELLAKAIINIQIGNSVSDLF